MNLQWPIQNASGRLGQEACLHITNLQKDFFLSKYYFINFQLISIQFLKFSTIACIRAARTDCNFILPQLFIIKRMASGRNFSLSLTSSNQFPTASST